MKVQITHKPENVLYNNILIIDVYTFSTTMSVLLDKGIKNLYAIGGNYERAYKIQEKLNIKNRKYILVDDSIKFIDEKKLRINGHPLPIFYKNKILGEKYSKYSIIYRSQNGSQAIEMTYSDGNNILIGSFINFDSTLEYIKNNFSEITLFIAGTLGNTNSDDLICAKYYEHFLLGNLDTDKTYYMNLIREMINSNNTGDFFNKYFNSIYGDILGFNLKLNTFPGVIKVSKNILLNEVLYKSYLV